MIIYIMIIRQFFIPGIAHSSYLLGGVSSCMIIDPARDPDIYLHAAEEEGFQIIGILETHLHADFISGHCDLHEITGAPIYAPKSAACEFPHIPVHEGSTIPLDDCSISVIETPGHTPEHVSYVVTHLSRGDEPVALFPGDTLFVGDVGRPDLFPGRAHELAAALYDSLHKKILKLPDHCEVYPAHGAGSFCGRSLSAKRSTTIGYERRFNEVLQIQDKETFIDKLTKNMPPSPDHFSRCSDMNRRGPTLLSHLPPAKPISPRTGKEILQEEAAGVLDTRRYDAFGSSHIPASWNIDHEINFSTFAGWVIPPDMKILLALHHPHEITKVLPMLHRVGIDQIIGYIDGGVAGWALAGNALDHVRTISVHELKSWINAEKDLIILDVRTGGEYAGYHIPGSVNIHWPDLRHRYSELPHNKEIIVMCATGARSSIACSILKRNGFSQIINVAGGYSGWIAAGYS
ncbi:MAG TPA: rhodanese-like domain-containing protein [Methanospirillum sp.]|uniref:MBL fold metallo-hydrolase n=1 Tax=Methanospirillum sp. TaxID=45200 RepID=UPI002C714E11|nr:rhodanese-like domain-containing protein [Methanospirillum sp.]HOJ96514.1 rhodanese-like domain-containing protein [Methanospirillum sp.]HOL41752.1 rhodanese-like domain-containing protein [Methanospirillum sp.]HPP77963.1 rhodanese-like domain-containing protein [Methanospirillum sp.]